ncbi:hypothetical protein [Pseudoduganella sp. GCM10020061]|uniref:hypothetical protein n=1 Tax=Pseudoduganella sp. GCM10020061 TaxID=3317345 RepID=UPI00362DCA6C
MKRTIGTALLALAPALALAQATATLQVPAAQHPATAQYPDGAPMTVAAGSKEQYAQAKAHAAAAYKAARAQCNSLAGTPKDICVAQAKAQRVRAEEDATAQFKNTLDAYTRARMRIAAANYNLDRARCGAVAGNDRDVCLGQAKASRVAAEVDARADKKSIEARADARDEKRTAQYKVALEKCDAFAGTVKDNCVSAAKSAYGE